MSREPFEPTLRLAGGIGGGTANRSARMAVAVAFAAAWIFAVLLRLWYLQFDRYEHYAGIATEQQQQVVRLDASRGSIYDARGRSLAVSVESFSAAADPRLIEQPEAVAELIAPFLDRDTPAQRRTLVEQLSTDRRFVWLHRKLDAPLAERLREALSEAGLERGMILLPEAKRYYPLGTLAGQILGWVGTDNHGLAGLEYRYDSVVSSETGRRTVIRDGLAGTLLDPNLPSAAARPGRDLHLTIDAAIQHIAERELAKAVESSNAESGSVVMLDPATGAVMAMASWPPFDPAHYSPDPDEPWRNRAVSDAYEPGSTFKMVTLAAALEANTIDTLARIDCGRGSIRLGKTLIRDHKSFDRLTVGEIIANSSNVGAIKLGLAAGPERLESTIRAFGFGEATGIDLPNESPGLLRPLARWSKVSPAYISIGQGVAITPLQLTSAFAAIANGGRLLRPHVVASIGDGQGGTLSLTSDDGPQLESLPIAPSTVRQVRSMLEGVVLDGTGKRAALDGYRAVGKTGTAQIAIQGGYAANRYVASFAGFAPVGTPRLAMSVVLHEPWPRYHGGEAAAPVFGAIAQQTLLYLGVEPETAPLERLPAPPLDSLPLDLSPLRTTPGDTIQLASASSERATVLDEPLEEGVMPDFTGLSTRDAVRLAGRHGLYPSFDGHGAVTRQEPAAGSPLELNDDRVALHLEATGSRRAAATHARGAS